MTTTPNLNLSVMDLNDPPDIREISKNMVIIDEVITNGTIDGGDFDEPFVVAHNASPYAHPDMLAYGGTLEEHMVDQLAHDNIILDGNAGQTERRAT